MFLSVVSNSLNPKLKNIFLPVKKSELVRFIPISLLMFFTLFNQNIIRILKDSILIAEISAEVVTFTKVYCVTPIAALFIIIYAKMVNKFSYKKIYTILSMVFAGYFIIFSFIIYPNTDIFHLNKDYAYSLMNLYPHLKWYIAILANWSYIIFYVLGELWPNVFYILLFWQLANEIFNTEEAKRLYTIISLIGNSALIIVGYVFSNYGNDLEIIKTYFPSTNSNVVLVQISSIVMVIITALNVNIVKFLDKKCLYKHEMLQKKTGIKPKASLIESFKYIVSSKYLWLILICSASFALSMNLIESVWKAKIKELHSTVNAYASFQGSYILWTGVAILIFTIIGNSVMRCLGWFSTAIITPIVIITTGVIFFIFVVFEDKTYGCLNNLYFATPLAFAVFMGAVQNVFAKGTKYSLWDTSREMLYIPLDEELKTKGKATVDLISSKIGKSASSLIQSIAFTLVPTLTYTAISPYLMAIFFIVSVVWILAIIGINKEYQRIVEK
jgi:AAA family ATP:ADP antiporter